MMRRRGRKRRGRDMGVDCRKRRTRMFEKIGKEQNRKCRDGKDATGSIEKENEDNDKP